jgi:hypothetical protein
LNKGRFCLVCVLLNGASDIKSSPSSFFILFNHTNYRHFREELNYWEKRKEERAPLALSSWAKYLFFL